MSYYTLYGEGVRHLTYSDRSRFDRAIVESKVRKLVRLWTTVH